MSMLLRGFILQKSQKGKTVDSSMHVIPMRLGHFCGYVLVSIDCSTFRIQDNQFEVDEVMFCSHSLVIRGSLDLVNWSGETSGGISLDRSIFLCVANDLKSYPIM